MTLKRLALLLLLACRAEAVVGGYDPGQDTTYDPIAAFGLRSDLESGHVSLCTATLIDSGGTLIDEPRPAVLTVRHCANAAGLSETAYAVRFRRRADGGIGSVAGGPSSYYTANVVAWAESAASAEEHEPIVGFLEEGSATHISPIRVRLYDDGAEAKKEFLLGGWGRKCVSYDENEAGVLILCSNVYREVSDEILLFWSFSSTEGTGCGPYTRDSGGPILASLPPFGELRVIGVIQGIASATHLAAYINDPVLWALSGDGP